MHFSSFLYDGRTTFGIRKDGGLIELGSRVSSDLPDLRAVLDRGRLDDVSDIGQKFTPSIDENDVVFLPVIPNARKILCVGLNYDAHRVETGRDKTDYPTLFTRFADTLVGHRQSIVLPSASAMLDFEGELAVIIGKAGRHIPRNQAMLHVAGYSCFNDATLRDWQRHTSQFTPGKNFPSTGAFGPSLVTAESIRDVNDLTVQTRLNGEIVQTGNTSEFVFDIPALIEYISTFTQLQPGDVIATGTPSGVGFKRTPPLFMQHGDQVEIEIQDIGVLSSHVVAERA